ncbi:hypothetical protein [Sphingomonas xanthus]|uniref:Uncharacterized protein n=1 Tax=Sphingomonas xanthus TaxID=2594473 RepID=A0A516IT74_9SPHN|nr:hypothetical protein [Sphingomonas xanthus]QDP20066.1 hypothetical protein FMM02_08925 [Sphingomonas xanthus]
MVRLLLSAASAALLMTSAAAAAVLVVRSSGPSAGAYPPGKALSDTHTLKLKGNDMVVLLDSRGTRTLEGPGNFSASASAAPAAGAVRTAGTNSRRVRLGAVRGAGSRSVWQADVGQSGNVCVANPGELTLYRADASAAATAKLTDAAGNSATIAFKPSQWDAPWPAEIPVASGNRVGVTGLGEPTTMTLKVLTPIPSGLEGMAQSLIRADCKAQLDVLIDTFSTRSGG